MSAPRYAIVGASPVGADLLAMIERPAETPLTGLTKRATQYLEAMMAKPAGISAIEFPGQRLADGIFKLRRAGLTIETLHEAHEGDAPGHHARYVLRSTVKRLPIDGAGIAASPSTSEQRAGL